jgi:Lar family restriction alleviation protein
VPKKTDSPKCQKIVLLRCPFCGYEAGRVEDWRETDDGPRVFVVECEACSANGPVMGGNRDRARAAWNHRGGPPKDFSAEARGTPEVVSVSEEEAAEIEEHAKAPTKPLENPKPCPWCDSTDIHVEQGEATVKKKKEPYFYTFCGNCEACGPAHDTSEGFAVLGWEKRFP